MKPNFTTVLVSMLALGAAVRGAETFDDAMKRASGEYTERLKTASEQLDASRRRIADEKAPLLDEMRAAEDRIIALESENERIQAGADNASNLHRRLLSDLDGIRKNTTYLDTLTHDTLAAFSESMPPGESQQLADRIQALQDKLDENAAGPSAQASADIAEFLLSRTQRELGGYSSPGSSLIDGNNQVVKGTFAFVGPETYFLPDGGAGAGTVRPRAGSAYPVSYPLTMWKPEDAQAFFQGRAGTIVADASGGKALRLKETRGTLIDHVNKGGLVAYFIIGVGLLALIMIAQKVLDLIKLSVDSPQTVHSVVALVAQGEKAKVEVAVKALKAPTREIFTVGLRYASSPKEILEEHLQSVLLRQRLHFERRLPLLAVIATAAPLMGLLGTVVGMVKTFALITVFGTGNAGKLASGISEVLVATELGLVVAIPTLIAHGFLAHRIQKNLSLLERYALEFVTAASTAKQTGKPVTA